MGSFNRFLILNLILSCASPSFATRVNRKDKQKRTSMLADDAVVVEKTSDVDEKVLEFRPARAKTSNGCTCKGDCGATKPKAFLDVAKTMILNKTGWGANRILEKVQDVVDRTGLVNDKGVCDWCWTEEGCGHKWGYCHYEKYHDFDELDHDAKTEKLWEAITDSQGESAEIPGKVGFITGALTVSMRTPFDDWYDVLPAGRKKAIHAAGVHCKISFDVASGSGYTGIFAAGSKTGFVRMGSAVPTGVKEGNIVPGLGFKFPRTGRHSGSFVALTDSSKMGHGRNFFELPFSNHATPPDSSVLRAKFSQASGCINMVGLSDLAKYTQDGEEIDNPEFPYELVLQPKPTVTVSDDAKDGDVLTALSGGLKEGDDLFDVFAHTSPQAKKDLKEPTKLGTMKLASECTTSLFGDTALFFRHQRMEEDFRLRQEWFDVLVGDGLDKDCLRKFSQDPSEWVSPTACKGGGKDGPEESE